MPDLSLKYYSTSLQGKVCLVSELEVTVALAHLYASPNSWIDLRKSSCKTWGAR